MEVGHGRSDAGHPEADDLPSAAAQDAGGFPDLRAVLVGEGVEILSDTPDETTDPDDLLIEGCGFDFFPVVGGGERGQAFPFRSRSARYASRSGR
ncbi:hypothetical protein AB0I54_35605 [Streptomyces sp. NPDC050625]|uniref:hypothetical protein n=1 Tax=Streptomyces sp. NPDC050625 TaxID=3154629 RepID=UPI003432608C